MVVIKGLRRTGKSSLIRVALNETGLPHILIDLRLAAPPTPQTFYEYFSAELSKFLEDGGLRKALSRIKGLEVSGLKLEFSEKKPSVIGRVLEEVGRRDRGEEAGFSD
jgi:AAA+ ATPase superfamily predicted ATPase